ncbi:MAG: hypothetical protein HQK65_21245 [Desulfamplus sp.]|nr:hypothetical protein [Desulfamplus sp.]
MNRTNPAKKFNKETQDKLQSYNTMISGNSTQRPNYNDKHMSSTHCLNRNNSVYDTLVHLAVMVKGGAFKEQTKGLTIRDRGATSQFKLPKSPNGASADTEISTNSKLSEKLSKTQDAHCLPCQIDVNNCPMDQWTPSQPLKLKLKTMFATVDRLPAIFNEVDSHIEKTGLKEAFRKACENIIKSPSPNLPLIKTEYQNYIKGAVKAMEVAKTNQEEKKNKAKNDDEIKIREKKIEIIEQYIEFTETQRPMFENIPPALQNKVLAGTIGETLNDK